MRSAARCVAAVFGAVMFAGIALSVAVNISSLATVTWKVVSAVVSLAALAGALWFVAGVRDELRTLRLGRTRTS